MMQAQCGSGECVLTSIDDTIGMYDSADEMGVYGGDFSCGEVDLPENEQYVVSVTSGGKSSAKTQIASDATKICGGQQSDDQQSDGECAITIDGPVCSGKAALDEMKNYVGKKTPGNSANKNDPVEIVAAAKTATGCKTEECALLTMARENPGVKEIVAATIRDNFKVDGPGDSTKWLNNDNIDRVLMQITKKHAGLYAMPFHMINFMRDASDSDAEDAAKLKLMPRINMRNISLVKDVLRTGKNMFCVVVNTDKYGKPGIHWFCLFCDFRPHGTAEDPYTIEYFNSSGSRARNEIAEWMHRAEEELESSFDNSGNPRHAKRVVAAAVQHQKDTDSECGVYSLYYIWRRINGAPITEFGTRIPDSRMIEFRSKLYKNRETSPAD